MSDILALRRNNFPDFQSFSSRLQNFASAAGRSMRQRRFGRNRGTFPYIRTGRLSRGRLRQGGSRTQTRTKSRNHGGVLGGTDADRKFIYQHKRMPKRKKRRWVKFVKKVHAVEEKELGNRTVLFNDLISQGTGAVAVGGQGCLTLALYPFNSTASGWLTDMATIAGIENTGNPTSAAGITTYGSTKFIFQSAVLDITLRNVSVLISGGGTVETLTPEASIEADLYEIIANDDTNTLAIISSNLSSVLNSYDDPEIGGAGTGLDIQTRGATPFEFGPQMGRYKMKVLKKNKFFIPNGQTITWQYRDPSRHVIRRDQMTDQDGINRKGWTRFFFIIYKLVPGLTQGTTDGTYRARVAVGATRKYRYKIEGANEDRERYFTVNYTPGNPS